MIEILSAIKTVIEGARETVDLVSALKPGAKKEELDAARDRMSNLYQALYAVQSMTSALHQENEELKMQLVSLKNVVADRKELELRPIADGAFAYIPKEVVQWGKDVPAYCQTCLDTRKQKSTLQFHERKLQTDTYKCPACDAQIHLPHGLKHEIVTIGKRGDFRGY